MKSRVKKRVIALMLCMVMVLSSGISTLAEGDAGTPEATEEVSSTNDESAVNTEPDTAVAEESQSRSNTAVETETAAEENAPAEAEAQPKTAEAAPAENTEEDAAAQTPVEETQTEETKDNAADAQSTEQSAENGEAVQEETTTPETENETAQNTETAPQPYEGKYEDDTIKITVSAEAGIVPEGAELSVTPIEKTKITDDMTAEEKAEAEKINEQYDLTEKKLNEDSEENEETMEGFLAYDISFLVNGEEVEPSGDVNVVMEFKEAAIPEGVSEDAAVTVKHLKEDETAEDGVVVEDMADKAEVHTTDKAEVEKVELTTDSFSTFTIYWGHGSLTIQVVDINGKGIGNNANTNLYNDRTYTVQKIASEISVGGNYTFSKAVIGWDFENATTEIKRLRRSGGENQYSTYEHEDNNWAWEEVEYYDTIFFIYTQDELKTVETLDNSDYGITMTMKNLVSSNQTGLLGTYGEEVTVDETKYYNVEQGIVNAKLGEDGFPTLTGDEHGRVPGQSLSALFSGGTKVNKLLLKSEYTNTGYFEYSSFKNYAYLNGSDFTVYDAIGTPSKENTWDRYYFERGNFLPYNNIEAGKLSNLKNLYGPDGKRLNQGDEDYNRELYLTGNGSSNDSEGFNVDYHFAYTMEANFYQPKEGQVTHNGSTSDMIYEFNGDDDLWIYIDDVLVLDIGGTHDAHTGTINFATGDVQVNLGPDRNGNDQKVNTTIRAMFEEAGVFPDGKEWNASKVDEYFAGNTFVDYSSHNLKMFYMERGGWASNLSMRFNLQTIPEGDVIVEKQLGVTGTGLDSQTFTFKAETSNDGISWSPIVQGTSYTITDSRGNSAGTGTVGADGSFQLQAGQRAIFSDLSAGTYFRATETSSGTYSTEVHVYGSNGSNSGKTGQLQVAENGTNYVLFVNTPDSSSLLNYDKTAEVKDYDNRVYEIDLTAATLGSSAGTEGENASIVLVLDASSSMEGNFSDLQDAAENFITTAKNNVAAEGSGDVEIAIVWYNGDQIDRPNSCTQGSTDRFYSTKEQSNIDTLNRYINNKTCDDDNGGTPMGKGLEAAQNLLEKAKYNKQYVIFFTDGMPGYYTNYGYPVVNKNCTVANSAYNQAQNIKDSGVTIYTIGFFDNTGDTFEWEPGHSDTSDSDRNHWNHDTSTSAGTFLSQYIASDGCSFLVDNAGDLSGIFTDIAGDLGTPLTTLTEKIVDVVDERFYPLVQDDTISESEVVWTDQNGNKYRAAKEEDQITDSKGNIGTVSYDKTSKTWSITWSNVTIANASENGWGASFYIKAKEDFMGGNAIPTNGTDSGIYLPDDDTISFPMPTVNVKLLTMRGEDKVVTYFKGETVSPKDFVEELVDTVNVVELVPYSSDTKTTIPLETIMGNLTTEQLSRLQNGEEIQVQYQYENTNDTVGVFNLKFEVVNNNGELDDHMLEKVGDSVEQYKLTVTYTAKTTDERDPGSSGYEQPVGTPVTSVSTKPTYTVNVVAGSITISKTVSVEDLREALGDDPDATVEFTFTIRGTTAYTPSYNNESITITFSQGDLDNLGTQTEITKTATAVTELAQDTYTISENPVVGFEAQNVRAGGLTGSSFQVKETSVNPTDITAQVLVGLPNTDTDKTQYINYRDGEVNFTNSKVTNKWNIVKVSKTDTDLKLADAIFTLSKDDDVVYTGTSNSEGILEWNEDGKPVSKLDQGTYILEETTAPVGYQKSTVQWEIEITASGALKSIGVVGDPTADIDTIIDDSDTILYLYTNKALYDLPESGGSGIYWYMLGGVLLMMAGSLLVYKKRRGEVLRRK